MIMKATEHDMYRLLDYKEKCLIRAGSCFGISGLLGFFLLFKRTTESKWKDYADERLLYEIRRGLSGNSSAIQK